MFVLDIYLAKDPRSFFYPMVDYAISEYLENTEKKIDDLGYKYVFYRDFETQVVQDLNKSMRKIADEMKLEPVDEFPVGAYKLMKKEKKLVIMGYGLHTIYKLADTLGFDGHYLNFYRLVSRVDAGTVPVVHSHLLFYGSPHPLIDDAAFTKISKFGFKPMVDDSERCLMDYEVRFERVFSSWSLLVRDMKMTADIIESRLDSEKGARELYAMSCLIDNPLDIAKTMDRVGRVMELPPKPNLDILILAH